MIFSLFKALLIKTFNSSGPTTGKWEQSRSSPGNQILHTRHKWSWRFCFTSSTSRRDNEVSNHARQTRSGQEYLPDLLPALRTRQRQESTSVTLDLFFVFCLLCLKIEITTCVRISSYSVILIHGQGENVNYMLFYFEFEGWRFGLSLYFKWNTLHINIILSKGSFFFLLT